MMPEGEKVPLGEEDAPEPPESERESEGSRISDEREAMCTFPGCSEDARSYFAFQAQLGSDSGHVVSEQGEHNLCKRHWEEVRDVLNIQVRYE